MAKVATFEKNAKRAKLIKKYAKKRAALNATIRNKATADDVRFEAVTQLAQLPRNGAKVRYRNRCKFSGRPRANYRLFGVSRIVLREMASNGMIPGVIKASW